MADKINEQLSALIDDECASAEQTVLLRQLSQNPDLQQRWQRYHLIGDTLKNTLPDAFDPQFCHRVQQAIAAEPTPLIERHQLGDQQQRWRQQRWRPQRWSQSVSGLAVAASLVVAVAIGVIALQQTASETGNQTNTNTIAVNPSPTPMAANSSTSDLASMTQQQAGENQPQTRLNDYLVNHNGLASVNGVHGIMPYMRVVSYNNNP